MPSGALDGDDAGVAAGHGKTRNGHELPLRHTRHVVHAKHGVAGKEFQKSVLQHLERPRQPFFSRLENSVHDAVKVAGSRQMTRRRQEHGGVPIVATGVHLAKHFAGPGFARSFINRQRIHVGAQANAPVAGARPQGAHHAGAAQPTVYFPAPALQALGHQIAGGVFLVGQFGIGVNFMPNSHHLGLMGTDGIKRGQGQRSVHVLALGIAKQT